MKIIKRNSNPRSLSNRSKFKHFFIINLKGQNKVIDIEQIKFNM